jgi:hypothetical protein
LNYAAFALGFLIPIPALTAALRRLGVVPINWPYPIPTGFIAMKTKLILFVAVLAAALFGVGCSSLDKGLVAYYPFDENAKDESGKGNDGDVKGATLAEDRHGKADSAYSFDGVDDHIYIASSRALKEMKAVSVSVWVNVDEKQKVGGHGYNSFVSRWNEDGPRLSFWVGIRANTHVAAAVAPYGGNAPVQKEYNIKGWLHVVYAHDSVGAALFLNGKRVVHAKDLKMELNEFDEPLIIGATRYPKNIIQFSNGSIDDVRIYNRALSTEEVKALYDLEKPKEK